MDKIKAIENEQLRKDELTLNVGDTVKVYNKIKEGNKERTQVFEGTIIRKQRGGSNETFTVRRVAYGTGVEKTFPVHSPRVEKVEIVRRGKIRRSKLYYLRDRVGKATRVKEDIVAMNAAAQARLAEKRAKSTEATEEASTPDAE